MANLSQLLIRSLAGTMITGDALAATGCAGMSCSGSRTCAGRSTKMQSQCGACKAKCGATPVYLQHNS